VVAVAAAALPWGPGAGGDMTPGVPADRPLRVLLVGDDHMVAAGPVVVEMLRQEPGRVDVRVDAVAGTGFASRLDWHRRIDAHLLGFAPDVVVASFAGTDSPPFALAPDASVAVPGSGEWLSRWGVRTRSAVASIATAGVRLYLVVSPELGDPAAEVTAELIRLGNQGLLYDRAGTVAFIDARAALAGPDGGFVAAGAGGDALRTPDGFGLAPAGAEILAGTIVEALRTDWCLDQRPRCVPSFGTEPAVPEPDPTRPRVLVVGDSLTFQAAPRLLARLGHHAQVHLSTRSTAGLLSSFYDWPGRVRREAAALDPDVVILQSQGGYRPPYLLDDQGQPVLPGTWAYLARWRDAAVALTAELVDSGAMVFWVLGPDMLVRSGDELIPSPLYRELVVRWPERVRGIEMWSGPTAITEVLGDGIHLAPAGVDRFADLVVREVAATGCFDAPGACRRPR
jgi:hypothetical protein